MQGLLTVAVVERLLSEEALAAPHSSNGSGAARAPAATPPAEVEPSSPGGQG